MKDKKTGALTYTERAKYGLIGVVIHEVGRNYFPMIVNPDERQWTWMDEGLNSFLQFQAEKFWDKDFPSRRGEPRAIAEYMMSQNQVPMMTQSDSVLQFGANGDWKPAVALVILRETILGRELFDRAFHAYANRWRFKHPTPFDFFRTMEESSGVDLDWFWRGWFYTTDHVNISLDSVGRARIDGGDPAVENAERRRVQQAEPKSLTASRNTERTVVERDAATRDFYDETGEFAVTAKQCRQATEATADLTPEERAARAVNDNFYRFTFSNRGGLVMPVILKVDCSDGTIETKRIPAEIWRHDSRRVTWQLVTAKTITRAELDPLWETADADRANNVFDGRIETKTLEIDQPTSIPNRMKDSDVKALPGSLHTLPNAWN